MQHVRGVFFPEADVRRVKAFLLTASLDETGRASALAQCSRFRRAVEVGAHVGLHTRVLARRFAATEAFEPQPQVFRCLAANLSGAGVTLHQVALASTAKPGFIRTKINRDSGAQAMTHEREPGCTPCAINTLDRYGWHDIDLIRVSVENETDRILAGAMMSLRASRPVLWLATPPKADGAVAQALQALGYGVAATPKTGVILTAQPARAAPEPADLVLRDAALGDRLLSLAPTGEPAPLRRTALSSGGRVHAAQVIPFRSDFGPGQVTAVTLEPNAGALAAEATLDARLAETRTPFVDGAFRLSLPPETLAYFREAVVSAKRPEGERVIARVDLLQAPNLDAIEIRVPLSIADRHIGGLSLRLRTPDGRERMLDLPAAIDPAEISAEMVTCYLNRGGGGNPVVNAFASSLGARLAYAEDGARDGAAIVWGVLRGSKDVIDTVQARGGFFYYIDHAYFARGHLQNYRVTRNGFEAGPIRECPDDRLAGLGIEVKPWSRGGDYILVCPPTDYFMQAHNAHTWLDDTLATLKAHTDRPIVVRVKPQPGEAVVPLEEAMAGAHALVTHSSNVAVEAVVAGAPVFVAPSSAAAPMGLTDLSLIEHPIRPDRAAWLAHLSYSQFSFDEVKSGEAWRLLREFETRPFVRTA